MEVRPKQAKSVGKRRLIGWDGFLACLLDCFYLSLLVNSLSIQCLPAWKLMLE